MPEDPAELRRQAQTALDQNKLRKAAGLMEQLVELEPSRVRNYLDLGRVLIRRGKPQRALPHLEKACELAPEGEPGAIYHQALGDCQQALGTHELDREKREEAIEHFEKALVAYDEALERDLEDAVVWNNRGFSNFSLGRFEEALRCYDESIRHAPSYAVAWYNRGYTLQIAGRLNQARQYYERSVELNPQDAIAWNNLGNVYYNQGHYERAIDIFKRSLEVEPNYTIAINNIGNALDHIDRYHESIGFHQRTLDLDPSFHYAWMAKGRALMRLGMPEEGLELIETAIELEPEDADYHVAHGDTLRELGRPQAARAAYNEALKVNEADGHAWIGLAELAEEQDEQLTALRFYDQAVRAFDGDARRRDLDQDWVLKADALEHVGFNAEALNQYHNALVIVPQSARANIARGKLLEQTDRYAEAYEAYQAAHTAQIQLGANDTAREHGFRTQQSLLGQSRCLHALGRSDEGLARLERLFRELKLAEQEVERDSVLAGSDLGLTGLTVGAGRDTDELVDQDRFGEDPTGERGPARENRDAEGEEEAPMDPAADLAAIHDLDVGKDELPTMELSRLTMEAEGHALRGKLLGETGDPLEAAESYKKAAELYARNYELELEMLPTRVPVRTAQAEAHAEAAINLKESGRHKEALEQAEAALSLEADELLPWLVAGELYLASDAFDRAQASFEGALAVDRYDETALVGIARAHLGQGHKRRALALARIATEQAPELPAAWRVRMDAAEVCGKPAEQKEAARMIEALDEVVEEGSGLERGSEEEAPEIPVSRVAGVQGDIEDEEDELIDTD